MIVSQGCGSAAYNETASRHHRLMKTMSKRSKRRNPHPCSLRAGSLVWGFARVSWRRSRDLRVGEAGEEPAFRLATMQQHHETKNFKTSYHYNNTSQ